MKRPRREPNLNEGRTVFARLMDELRQCEFDKCVRRCGDNHSVRSLPTCEPFLFTTFAPWTDRESLRDFAT